jgi:hypothetical protein
MSSPLLEETTLDEEDGAAVLEAGEVVAMVELVELVELLAVVEELSHARSVA